MYPSDVYMTFSHEISNDCYSIPNYCHGDVSISWIYSEILDQPTWLISPLAHTLDSVFHIYPWGNLGFYNGNDYNNNVRPTLYLSLSVKIIDGDGSSGNPYKLSL